MTWSVGRWSVVLIKPSLKCVNQMKNERTSEEEYTYNLAESS